MGWLMFVLESLYVVLAMLLCRSYLISKIAVNPIVLLAISLYSAARYEAFLVLLFWVYQTYDRAVS